VIKKERKMYTGLDLMEKLILQAKWRKQIWANLKKKEKDVGKKILLKMLRDKTSRDITYYEQLTVQMKTQEAEIIDFFIYDKVASLMNQYKARIESIPQLKTKNEIINFAIELEEGMIALLLDIQGRLVQKSEAEDTRIYKLLLEMIDQKSKYVDELKRFTRIKAQ
jgi:hypothetical protein